MRNRESFTFVCFTMVLSACASGPVHVNSGEHVVQSHVDTQPLSYRYGPTPSNWQAIAIEGNDVAWIDRQTEGVIHVDHSCAAGQDVPLASLIQHLLIGFTERETVSEETLQLAGREARHVVVGAKLDGVPTMLDLYVLKKDGCVYDFGYVGPPERFPSREPAYSTFVHGFTTLQTGTPLPNGTP